MHGMYGLVAEAPAQYGLQLESQGSGVSAMGRGASAGGMGSGAVGMGGGSRGGANVMTFG